MRFIPVVICCLVCLSCGGESPTPVSPTSPSGPTPEAPPPAPPPAATLRTYDIDLNGVPGNAVVAGQPIGTHIGDQTWSDVTIAVNTPQGYRLVSWFDAITDEVFEASRRRGMSARSDAIITRAERDASPLSCNGETFVSKGPLENWVMLR